MLKDIVDGRYPILPRVFSWAGVVRQGLHQQVSGPGYWLDFGLLILLFYSNHSFTGSSYKSLHFMVFSSFF